MGDATDEELAARWKAGDEGAARALLDRHVPRLRVRAANRLRGILRRRVGASDVIQEAYLAVYRRLDDFEDRGPGSFGHWVSKILDHKLRDEVRRHVGSSKRDVRGEVTQAGTAPEERAVANGQSPASLAGRHESSERVALAIAGLPERQRDVLRLVHEQRLSFAQVGASVGCTAEAATKVYARAVSRLAELMRETPEARP